MKKKLYVLAIVTALIAGNLTVQIYAQDQPVTIMDRNDGSGGGGSNSATCYSTYTTPLLGGGTTIFVCGICTQTKAKTFSDPGTCYF